MRKHPILTIVSTLLVVAGVTVGGYAISQIREMNVSSGSQVLPELTHFPEPQLTHSAANQLTQYRAQVSPNTVYANLRIKTGDYLGTITIPALNKTLPIYEGTEDAQLKMGVGHYEGSVLPGIQDNSVLAGHRDSVFSNFGKLKLGDLVIINTSAGKFTYKIFEFRIVNADDRTVIVPTQTAILTLSTCYPFYFIGNAPKRYIVSANLIPATPSS